MPKIIVEFYASNANKLARDWRQELIVAIEKAICDLENQGFKLFSAKDFSVYMTFKEG